MNTDRHHGTDTEKDISLSSVLSLSLFCISIRSYWMDDSTGGKEKWLPEGRWVLKRKRVLKKKIKNVPIAALINVDK